MSVPSHPLKPFSLAIGLTRLYEARSFNIKPFSGKARAVLNYAHLNNINIQENNILFLAFPTRDIQIFNYSNPFSGYDKAGTADVIYRQLFSFHRNKYSKYIPVYTEGSKTAGHVGCGVVFNNTILSFTLYNFMSVFSAELTAILVALHHILVSNHRQFCVYTVIMSALESLHFLRERRQPTVMEILILLQKLERKGFDIIFSWVPGHVGILGNEQADNAARSMSDHMQQSVCYQDLKTYIQNYIHHIWQETWDQQILNKLHGIHPSTSHWAALPGRKHDVSLTRLRIGHTRFTHRHLLLGENAPECPFPYSVYHILKDCFVFNHHHITFFYTSVFTLPDLTWINFGSSLCIGINDPILCKPCILNVVSKLCPSQILVAPNDVIWNQELNLRILHKNKFESSDWPARSDFKGFGGVGKESRSPPLEGIAIPTFGGTAPASSVRERISVVQQYPTKLREL
ncbi:putative RNA-directed DNA polymerase from transposon X-element [Trichonephila clavipes]|nr:putative RNA-directed DNA polymerase from transposon X-element [Trichonephila clavipes]